MGGIGPRLELTDELTGGRGGCDRGRAASLLAAFAFLLLRFRDVIGTGRGFLL